MTCARSGGSSGRGHPGRPLHGGAADAGDGPAGRSSWQDDPHDGARQGDAVPDCGVLLLNTSLFVEEGKAGSHANAGWHRFTDAVLAAVNARRAPAAFVLWGSHARKKAPMLDDDY